MEKRSTPCCSTVHEENNCGCSGTSLPTYSQQSTSDPLKRHFIEGSISTGVGPVPVISTSLNRIDHLGALMVRCGIRRHDYRVDPGLYAVGNPGPDSHVLVTANYKLSFDSLRKELGTRDLWILVLDTDGVNVWCAAGKGTFGTNELVNRLAVSGIDKVVSHNKLILPQLSGPGVAAHEIKKLSGFRVIYGPILAKDLPAFLDAGLKATSDMRKKKFGLPERLVLIPVELVPALKVTAMILPVFVIVGGFIGSGPYLSQVVEHASYTVPAFALALLAGSILTPALLPWLPGRAFWIKGLMLGLVAALFLTWINSSELSSMHSYLEFIAWSLMVPAMAAYLGMNFTGASTFTSLSGVRKEMRVAVPVQIVLGSVGLLTWLAAVVVS